MTDFTREDMREMTKPDDKMLNAATPDQIERANAAVTANLNEDGSPKFNSAQGYACALTAIMQSDAVPQSQRDSMEGEIAELRGLLRSAELELRDSAKAALNRNSPLTAEARITLADEISAALNRELPEPQGERK